MPIQYAKSPKAIEAKHIVESLQMRFIEGLEDVSSAFGSPQVFNRVEWLRKKGVFGGGYRFVCRDNEVFNSATVNISQVQYEYEPNKPLNSATAISVIIHPQNPLCPSVHMHYSLTELKDGTGSWRLMSDLNPAIIYHADRVQFLRAIKSVAGDTLDFGIKQGDKYFEIPPLSRHRGVIHYYLENHIVKDVKFVERFGQTMMDCYLGILSDALSSREPSDADKKIQLDYHSAYMLQVLLLDRGTTSGLLAHNENDMGIMGSIPRQINREILRQWADKMQVNFAWQSELLKRLIVQMPKCDVVMVDEVLKQQFANTIRNFFSEYPQNLSEQASGFSVPLIVKNHHLTAMN